MAKVTKTTKKKRGRPKKPTAPARPVEAVPMPTAGKIVKDFESELDRVIDENPQPQWGGVRPGAGRPPKAAEAAEQSGQAPPQEIPPDIQRSIMQVVSVPFDLWAARVGVPDLALSNAEAAMIAEPAGQVLAFYLPNFRPIDWAWAALAMAGIAVMRPRLVLLDAIRKTQRDSSSSATGSPPARPPAPGVSGKSDGFPKAGTFKPQKL